MAIVEVLVGAIFSVLLKKLASDDLLKFLRPVGIDTQMKKWRQRLMMIEAVLADADNKQLANRGVREWLNELEDLAYDVDDLVDEFNTEASLLKLKENHQLNKPSTSKVRRFISTCCSNFSLHDYMSDHGIASKLKEIDGRLEGLANQISILHLIPDVRERATESKGKRLQPTSLEESHLFGRDKDKEEILKIISMGVKSNDDPVSVIPIVGMGGVGKTTLAQMVYNDDKLKDEFDLKAWACVSDQFDALMVTKTILKQVSPGRYDDDDLNMLQVKLKENLSNKRFFLVLDDVWNEKYGDWDILRRPFLAGKPGSSILVTTRTQKVAKIMSPFFIYHLTELSNVDALSLLAQHGLEAKTFDAHPDLRDIGKCVVRRCKNLPLAVKAVGAILRTKVNPEDWDDLLNSNIWISGEESEILPALKLSYQYLPSELKRCFAYCAIFPKDYEFDKSHLVLLWMAEGFVQQSEQERSMEEIGGDYFDKLLSRSFFQQSSVNSSRFVMHDLHNDLAMHVAGNKYLRLENTLKDNHKYNISEKVRHSSFVPVRHQLVDGLDFIQRLPSLRTFLTLYSRSLFFVSQRVLHDILLESRCLRVLSLSKCYSLYELPSSIGHLRHLRYLNLQGTSIKWLPESLINLINLQVLILSGCDRLTQLPACLENLVNLRYLDIADTNQLQDMPQGISQLTSLQTLSKMIVSKNRGLKLKDLGNLSLLEGKISIVELQNVENVQEATAAMLKHKPGLNEVRLSWSNKFDDSRNEVLELNVLDALEPHPNLSSLTVESYGGAKLSSWMGDPSFSKLTVISFYGCKSCRALAALGQLPSLRDLSIKVMGQIKVIGVEFYGVLTSGKLPFQSLQTLTFEDMLEWEDWFGLLTQELGGTLEFPMLHKLFIRKCPNLIRLPILLLPSVRELEVDGCSEAVLSSMHNLSSLIYLKLKSISGLTSVSNAFVQFPRALEKVKIVDCEELVSLWSGDNTSESLVNVQKVVVENCPRLSCIQEPTVLREMAKKVSLEFLPNSTPLYKQLSIYKPSSLEMKTLPECCQSLDSLEINCQTLSTISNAYGDSDPGESNLLVCENLNLTALLRFDSVYSCLTKIRISNCGLESFPHGCLPTPNLRSLYIYNCPHLKSLPDEMKLLSSLQLLSVWNSPSLVEPFPQGNIPPNLRNLSIQICGDLSPLREWGLSKLSSLSDFTLGGAYPELVSFSDGNEDLLPPSLTWLTLYSLPSLETLSMGFENLTSLQHLWMANCPKLSTLPKENQLGRLWSLDIRECPLLKKRCLKDYWPIIVDIPQVCFDGYHIYDPEFCHELHQDCNMIICL